MPAPHALRFCCVCVVVFCMNQQAFYRFAEVEKTKDKRFQQMLFPGIRGEGWAPIPTGKMNSFGTGNCDPARTPQRFCARPRGPHGASLGPCAGGVGVPARAWGRAGGALECAVWVQIAQRYEIRASGWLPGGPSTRTATAQPLGDLATPQRTEDPPVGSHVGEGAGEGRGAPVRRPHNTLAMWLLAVATRQPSAAVRARAKYVTFCGTYFMNKSHTLKFYCTGILSKSGSCRTSSSRAKEILS